jgi:peptide deformylase
MPKLLPITTNPDKLLRKRSKPVPVKSLQSEKGWASLVADMALTMLKKDGAGIAAPQIGKNIRVIIVNTKEGPIAMFNPDLVKKSWAKEWGVEGCLSVPGVFGEVKRHKIVACKYLDLQGNEQCLDAKGLMARVIQHEIDHLDGILFIDKAKNLKIEN